MKGKIVMYKYKLFNVNFQFLRTSSQRFNLQIEKRIEESVVIVINSFHESSFNCFQHACLQTG